jgi:hypothetical protein
VPAKSRRSPYLQQTATIDPTVILATAIERLYLPDTVEKLDQGGFLGLIGDFSARLCLVAIAITIVRFPKERVKVTLLHGSTAGRRSQAPAATFM